MTEALKERRKQEIAALPRKELNAHAYLLEQEQEEYERENRQLLNENDKLRAEIQRLRDRLEDEEERENRPRFKMDANGNLTRIEG